VTTAPAAAKVFVYACGIGERNHDGLRNGQDAVRDHRREPGKLTLTGLGEDVYGLDARELGRPLVRRPHDGYQRRLRAAQCRRGVLVDPDPAVEDRVDPVAA
jgi:hypothetical protein